MGVRIAVTRAAADTGGGNQTFTATALGGLTPVAALFIVSLATSDGSAANGASLSIGAATGSSNRWCFAGAMEDAQATTDTYRLMQTDECIHILDGAGDLDGEADFSSFGVNSVVVNWGVAPSAGYLITVVLFAGSDAEAYADAVISSLDEDSVLDITDPGFEPDVVFAGYQYVDDEVKYGYNYFGFGVAVNDGSDTQRSWMFLSIDNLASSAVSGQFNTSYVTGRVDSSGICQDAVEVDDFDSDGFSLITRESNGAISVFYLALKLNDVDVWVDTIDTPTSTGSDSQTGPGFKPQFVMCGMTQMPAVDTAYNDGNAGSVGVCVLTKDAQYCNSIQDEDAEGTTDTQSLSDDQAVNFNNDDGSAAHAATFTSFDPTGWTWNFSATEGTAVKWWALAIEDFRTPVKMNHYRRLRI